MNVHRPAVTFAPSQGLRGWLGKLEVSRARLRSVLMIGGALAVAISAAAIWISGGRYVSTDNAYVQAPKLMVTTDVSGLVAEVLVHEGQVVQTGDVLFRLDPTPFRIALDSAKAQLAQTALTIDSMRQDYRRLQSDIAAQVAQVDLAQATYNRSASLIKSGSTTAVTYDQARFGLTTAQSQHQSLERQAEVLLAKLGGNPDIASSQHPTYLQMKAQVDEAQRQLDHVVVRAPFSGVVTQVDQLQPGTYLVAASAALTNTGAVAVVGTDELWIEANFKETDLTFAQADNQVAISVDAYPGATWSGKVKSIAPATGAVFSILPAQNASGNWVKVVQRFPVKISVDKQSGPKLRVGMSVNVTIDTGHRRALADLW